MEVSEIVDGLGIAEGCMSKSTKTFTRGAAQDRRIPDVMYKTKDGKVALQEVVSKTQTVPEMRQKALNMRSKLPEYMQANEKMYGAIDINEWRSLSIDGKIAKLGFDPNKVPIEQKQLMTQRIQQINDNYELYQNNLRNIK